MRSLLVAYLLWFFLGSLGIHKFYVGNNTMGLVYLLCTVIGAFTTFIFIGFLPLAFVGIMWLIDLFTLPSQVSAANRM